MSEKPELRKFKTKDLVEKISEWNVRKRNLYEDIGELAQNIKEEGIIHQPIVSVFPDGPLDDVVAGQRRIIAASRADVEEIWCEVRHFENEIEKIYLSLSKGLHSVRPDIKDIGDAVDYLLKHGETPESVAKRLGKPVDAIYMYLHFRLIPEIKGRAKTPIIGRVFEAQELIRHQDKIKMDETDQIVPSVNRGALYKPKEAIMSTSKGYITPNLWFEALPFRRFMKLAKGEGLTVPEGLTLLIKEAMKRGYIYKADANSSIEKS